MMGRRAEEGLGICSQKETLYICQKVLVILKSALGVERATKVIWLNKIHQYQL